MINDRINLLSGRSSTGYALVTVIKTVAILFVIILAVQGVFHLPYYFCGLCGYFIVVSCVNITLMKIWVIFKWVLCFIWNVFPEPIKAIRSCPKVYNITWRGYYFSSFWNGRSFWQLSSLCSIVKMTMLWVKSISWWTHEKFIDFWIPRLSF